MKAIKTITVTAGLVAAGFFVIPSYTAFGGAGCCGAGGGSKAKVTANSKAKVKVQTNCPIMGGKINKSQYADVNGKRIYVCCPGCIGKIKADPDKYIKMLEKQGVTLEKAPKAKKARVAEHPGS